MAVKNIPVPFCDQCGEPWLPKFKQPDGTHNPIFDNPEESKRCGKCKTTRWNAAGVDKRRKDQAVSGDKETAVNNQTPQDLDARPGLPPAVSMQDVLQTIDRPTTSTGRCKHMLFNCPECHKAEAA